jgi:glycosyltransferase involved in cell wall biosynthesis
MCSKYYQEVCPHQINNVVTVENGIDIEDFDEVCDCDVDNYTFPNSNEINLVYIGRFNSQKGLHILFDIALPENVNIYFVGGKRGGDLYETILQLCRIRKNFYYLGEKVGKEKIVIMKKADAILFPSLHEPFGIVGLETMACKTVCITTRVNGIGTYMLPNMCVEIYDLNAEEAINRFLEMTPAQKKEITDRAYEQVKNYTWKNISIKFQHVLNSVAESVEEIF